VKAVCHTALQVYEKSLQGKDVAKADKDVDHFLDLEVSDDNERAGGGDTGNPFDEDYDETGATSAAAAHNPFGAVSPSASVSPTLFSPPMGGGGGVMPGVMTQGAVMPGMYAGAHPALQQQLLLQQQQHMLMQQQHMQRAAMMQQAAMQQGGYPGANPAMFAVSAAQPAQQQQHAPAAQPAKPDIFAALNPF
jgi:hypothetical protein